MVVHDSLFRAVCRWTPALEDLAKAILKKPQDARIKITLLKSADDVSEGYERDVAFCANETYVILCEHQSTWNPNMPLRMLRYVGRELYNEAEVRCGSSQIYGKRPVIVRVPKLAVFYPLGLPKEHNNLKTMSLRDMMLQRDKEHESSVDLSVNILSVSAEAVKSYHRGTPTPSAGAVAVELSIIQRRLLKEVKSPAAIESAIIDEVNTRNMFIKPCITALKRDGGLRAVSEAEAKRIGEASAYRAEGKAEGKVEGKAEDIMRMVSCGVTWDNIAKFTGLSAQQAQSLYKKYHKPEK